MDFGRVEHIAQIENIDFSLPPDNRLTVDLLKGLVKDNKEPAKVYIGCTRWGNKEWIGKVYPKGTKEKDFLAHYVRQFNSIELNALFYNLQPREVIERWASLTKDDFRFCPKFTNTISHIRQLKNVERETELFIDHIQSFGSTLGPSFLQLSDSFGPNRAVILQDFVRQLPRDFKTCVELRHEEWFAGRDGVPDTWEMLRESGVGTVITDTSGRRDCLHMKLTAPVAFIRFVANNLHPTDLIRIEAWADRINTWIENGLREIYFFLHSHDELNAPELCRYATEQFNKKCGLDLKPPKLYNNTAGGNLTLF
ncbi:DUF72 domain-containing protein [Flavitalea flava]